MLSRCSSPWLRLRLPHSIPRLHIPGSLGSRTTIHCKAQAWNSNRQLFISAPICHQNSHYRIPVPITTLRASAQSLTASMASQSHIRSHSGHGGHHHHAHDNTYLVSSNKSDAGVRITRIGLFVNLAMAIGKGIGGYVFHSQCKRCTAFLLGYA